MLDVARDRFYRHKDEWRCQLHDFMWLVFGCIMNFDEVIIGFKFKHKSLLGFAECGNAEALVCNRWCYLERTAYIVSRYDQFVLQGVGRNIIDITSPSL